MEKENIKKQNKQLRNIFILIIAVLGVFLASYFFIDSIKQFEYEGLKFKVVKEQDLIFYNTAIPIYQGSPITGRFIGDYNFYLRKDPRIIGEEVAFKGELRLLENIVFNSTQDFNCDGDGIIAVANLANLLGKMGANVIKNDSLNCDWAGDYNFIRLMPGDKTEIRMPGPACYDLIIKDCEILEVTERFMLEIFKEIDKAENEE